MATSPTHGWDSDGDPNSDFLIEEEERWWTEFLVPMDEVDLTPPPESVNRDSTVVEDHHEHENRFSERLRRGRLALWGFGGRVRSDPMILAYIYMNLFKLLANADLSIGGRVYLPMDWFFKLADQKMVREVAKKGERSVMVLAGVAFVVTVAAAANYYTLLVMKFDNVLMFRRVHTNLNYFHIYLSVLVFTDYLVKYLTIMFKILVALLPGFCVDYKTKEKMYHFIELSSQLYRSLIPIYPWLVYFTSAYSDWPLVFRMIAYLWAVLYIPCKMVTEFGKRLTNWFEAWLMLSGIDCILASSLFRGKNGSTETNKDETICSICHDKFKDPMRLQCRHIFCENCVTTWFSHQRMQYSSKNTCPLCRTKVQLDDKVQFRDGSTLAKKICI